MAGPISVWVGGWVGGWLGGLGQWVGGWSDTYAPVSSAAAYRGTHRTSGLLELVVL